MELGSVTLERIGFFCFPIKHSTHTLKRIGFFCFPIKHSTHTPRASIILTTRHYIVCACDTSMYACTPGCMHPLPPPA